MAYNKLEEIENKQRDLRSKICNIKKNASEKEDKELAILNEEARELKKIEYARRKVVALKFADKLTRISALLYRNAILNRQPFKLENSGRYSYVSVTIFRRAEEYSPMYQRTFYYGVEYPAYRDTNEVDKFKHEESLLRCDDIIEELQDITHMLDGFENHIHCQDECAIW